MTAIGDKLALMIDREGLYRNEGHQGVRNLETIVRKLNPDYRNIDAFLADNPGAIDAIVEWLSAQGPKEWHDALADYVDAEDVDWDERKATLEENGFAFCKSDLGGYFYEYQDDASEDYPTDLLCYKAAWDEWRQTFTR